MPHTKVRLGDMPGTPRFKVGPPFGHEMVIALASDRLCWTKACWVRSASGSFDGLSSSSAQYCAALAQRVHSERRNRGTVDRSVTMEWLLKPLAWIFAWRLRWRDVVGTLVLRVREHFYLVLAIVFVVAGTVDQFVRPFSTGLSNASFDWLMRHRPIAYVPDSAIMSSTSTRRVSRT